MKKLIEAFQIFIKYTDSEYPTNCEHDTLYVQVDPSLVSDEDKKELELIGFIVDESLDCFYSFKYGSC